MKFGASCDLSKVIGITAGWKDFSRKGAKTQSAAAFPKDFLCAFASLREKSSIV
jgi:hypothetical protein